MEKFVLVYTIGDGSSLGFETATPVEYESEEKLFLDFITLAREAWINKKGTFLFLNEEFCTNWFYVDDKEYPPKIWSLEEWFSYFNINK